MRTLFLQHLVKGQVTRETTPPLVWGRVLCDGFFNCPQALHANDTRASYDLAHLRAHCQAYRTALALHSANATWAERDI